MKRGLKGRVVEHRTAKSFDTADPIAVLIKALIVILL